MEKETRMRVFAIALALGLSAFLFLVSAPSASGCTFSALKSVTLSTDPPRPVVGKPFALNAILLFGGGMGHGNMLTAADNAVSTTLTLPTGIHITKGDNPLQTAPPTFCLGYENTFVISWEAVADKPGRALVRIEADNTTLGEGQESMATERENGLLDWEVVRPSMLDTRIESGDKEAIAEASLAHMPSLRQKEWQVLPQGDVTFVNADGIRYSAAKDELALGVNDPSPVLVTDARGNKYIASNGYIDIVDGPEVFAPIVQPAQPATTDAVAVQAKLSGAMDGGKAAVVYSDDGESWERTPMTPTVESSIWQGVIPPPENETSTVDYYLEVTDQAGKAVTTPRYAVHLLPKEAIAEGVRKVTLLALAVLLAAIAGVILWARWDLARRARRAREPGVILAGEQPALHAQRMTGILEQVRRPISAGGEQWWIGFYVLIIIGLVFAIIGLVTDQFQIINLIIKMG
jgi:hypothetical protein